MKKKYYCLIIFLLILLLSPSYISFSEECRKENINDTKRNLFSIIKGYYDYFLDLEVDESGKIYLVMNNNCKILYDDLREKSVNEKFVNADLQDFFEEKYPLGQIVGVMELNMDPGRLRNYQLLSTVYGNNKREIEKNLTTINTKYGSVIFNKSNNAALNLKKALDEVAELANNNHRINGFVVPISGTYNYRVIQDTGMLSPHSYGIAIDLNRNDADYWKWVSKEKGSNRIRIYPKEIVESFEKYGFVWGGKWSHFDILHFEYKPEILIRAKYFTNEEVDEKWDCEISKDVENIEIIKLINEKIN